MYRELFCNKGSRYYFRFQKLAFSKPKITRTDGDCIWLIVKRNTCPKKQPSFLTAVFLYSLLFFLTKTHTFRSRLVRRFWPIRSWRGILRQTFLRVRLARQLAAILVPKLVRLLQLVLLFCRCST